MNPNLETQREKQLRAVVREIDRLREIVQHPPSIRLEKPIQKGWIRRYVLSKEADARPDRETLAAILGDIGPERHSPRPDFLKKKRRGSRQFVQMEQPLNEILIDNWSTQRYHRRDEWKVYFHFEYKPYWQGFQWFYIFTEAHLFELKVEPYWLTHLKIIDGPVIARVAELEAWMKHHAGAGKYDRLKGRRQWPLNTVLHSKMRRQTRRDMYRLRMNPEEVETSPHAWRIHVSFFLITLSPRSPTEEALRSERKGCGCKSCRGDHFHAVTIRHS